MGILLKARNYLNKTAVINLYGTFIYPYLIYCIEVWGNACEVHLEPLMKLQNKILSFSHYTSSAGPDVENYFSNAVNLACEVSDPIRDACTVARWRPRVL